MNRVMAIRPAGWGSVVHLHLDGYQPSTKPRPDAMESMCGAYTKSRPYMELADAARWVGAESTPDDPRPEWRWCRSCVGHAAAAHDLLNSMVAAVLIAERAAEEKEQQA